MSKIDRVGTFRGRVVDRSLVVSKNGALQLVLSLEATQMWDNDNKVWVDWNYDECETMAYLTLFDTHEKATLGLRQAMKALGWDGMNLFDLQDSDKLNTEVQFRIQEHRYNDNVTLQVCWVDMYDAEPGRKLQKLDAGGIAKLQARYAGALVNVSGGPKPKSAPAKVDDAVEQTKPKPKAKAGNPTSMNTAWQRIYEAGTKAGKTQIEITQAWTDVVKSAGGPEKIGEDWSGVEADVLKAFGL